MNLEELKVVDADVVAAIEAEMDRQNSHIELIASENWVSDAVMEAQGSIMTNKYAEGYMHTIKFIEIIKEILLGNATEE